MMTKMMMMMIIIIIIIIITIIIIIIIIIIMSPFRVASFKVCSVQQDAALSQCPRGKIFRPVVWIVTNSLIDNYQSRFEIIGLLAVQNGM